MAVRVRYSIAGAVSSSPNEEKDLGNLKMEQATDSQADGGSQKNLIPANTADVDITPVQLTTVRMLVIKATPKNPNDAPAVLTLKKDSTGGEPWTLSALSGTREAYFAVTTDSVTALFVSNTGSVDMEVTVMAAGD